MRIQQFRRCSVLSPLMGRALQSATLEQDHGEVGPRPCAGPLPAGPRSHPVTHVSRVLFVCLHLLWRELTPEKVLNAASPENQSVSAIIRPPPGVMCSAHRRFTRRHTSGRGSPLHILFNLLSSLSLPQNHPPTCTLSPISTHWENNARVDTLPPTTIDTAWHATTNDTL